MLLALIVIGGVLAIAWLPQAWVNSVLKQHSGVRPDLPGTGAQFARRTLDQIGLGHVEVEPTAQGDHYDPASKTVRLSKAHHDVRSLAAVVVAAHEIGHAMQDATGYPPLERRTAMAATAQGIERMGSFVMLAAPVLLIVMKNPAVMLLDYIGGALILAVGAGMHALTLPVELDASFRRALPLLRDGKLIPDKDLPAARQILRAAAFTYVASALMTMLNVVRWFRVLRF